MCGSMVDIQSSTAEIRRGKKKRRQKSQGKNIMVCSITYRATIISSVIIFVQLLQNWMTYGVKSDETLANASLMPAAKRSKSPEKSLLANAERGWCEEEELFPIKRFTFCHHLCGSLERSCLTFLVGYNTGTAAAWLTSAQYF